MLEVKGQEVLATSNSKIVIMIIELFHVRSKVQEMSCRVAVTTFCQKKSPYLRSYFALSKSIG